MKNLFEPVTAAEVQRRIASIRPDSPRQWGKMSVAQAMSHCATAMETAVGERRPERMFIGRLIGGMVKKAAIGNNDPLKKNTPTASFLMVQGEPDLAAEKERFAGLVQRFAAGGPGGCTTHPHTFFGPMTPPEWAVLLYKHADHHLRQFGA